MRARQPAAEAKKVEGARWTVLQTPIPPKETAEMPGATRFHLTS